MIALASQTDDTLTEQIELLMGSRHQVLYLKRSSDYGKLDLLRRHFVPAHETNGTPTTASLSPPSNLPTWDTQTFGHRCAGCHTTAVDTKSRAFSAIAIDCFACHGAVDLAHTGDPRKVLLSKQNQVAREVVSICGQCHLRGGQSQSSGLPYANSFIAGDNLFKDFKVDLSVTALEKLPPGERHIFENARNVAVLGQQTVSCLSCHDVHAQSTERHQALAADQTCLTCHQRNTDQVELNAVFRQSRRTPSQHPTCLPSEYPPQDK